MNTKKDAQTLEHISHNKGAVMQGDGMMRSISVSIIRLDSSPRSTLQELQSS